MKRLTPLIVLLLAGCANPVKESDQLIRDGKLKEGVARMEEAVRESPENIAYRAALFRNREVAVNDMLVRAYDLRETGRLEEAESLYREVLSLHPYNAMATAGLDSIITMRRQDALIADARKLVNEGKPEEAKAKLRTVLIQTPSHGAARELFKSLEGTDGQAQVQVALAKVYQKPVSLEFRDAPLSLVFNSITQQTQLNFVFDKEVRADLKATISVRNTPMQEAFKLILAANQLDKKVLNGNTILIYPNQAAKQKDYQELIVKTIYLGNADAKVTMNMIKTMLKTRDVFVDEQLNMLIMRDTPEVIRMAEKLIAAQDKPQPEVMLDVEVLEIKRTRLTELGILYPSSVKASVLPSGGSGSSLLASDLHRLSSRDIALSDLTAKLNLLKTDGDVNLLANPRIRVKNREKAKIHIGDRVPVITTTSSPTVGVSESVNYLDVGLKLDVEPNVFLQDEVGIKVALEVSNIVDTITNTETGTRTYQVGTRNAATVLRLRNGETQVLAGLISDEDRKNANKIPGLGDLPLVGRLFSNHKDDRIKTEIVLLITPHIVRNLEQPDPEISEFLSGTENTLGAPPLQLRMSAPTSGAPPALPASAVTSQDDIPPQPATPKFAPGVGLPPGLTLPAGVTPNTTATTRAQQ